MSTSSKTGAVGKGRERVDVYRYINMYVCICLYKCILINKCICLYKCTPTCIYRPISLFAVIITLSFCHVLEREKSSDLLKLRDARIEKLEEEIQDLTKRLTEADQISKIEMDRSRYYLEVINNLTAFRPSVLTHSSSSIEDRELELEEMAVEIDSLKEQVATLEMHLQRTTSDLEKTKRQLNTVIESEKKIKRDLGLHEDADEMEVSARIQEMKRSQAKLKTTQNELDRINEMKDAYIEKIRKLSQDVSRMNADRRRKDLQLQRMKRNKEDNHALQNARTIINGNRHNPPDKRVLEEINLPRIDIQLPSARNRTISRKFSSAPDLPIHPQFQLTRANSTFRNYCYGPINDPRYCVLCRCEYSVSQPCRIHTVEKRDGRFPCCNAADNGVRAMGCHTLRSHLYFQFAGVDNECRFYDQQGKLVFCFKNNEGEEQGENRVSFLSCR